MDGLHLKEIENQRGINMWQALLGSVIETIVEKKLTDMGLLGTGPAAQALKANPTQLYMFLDSKLQALETLLTSNPPDLQKQLAGEVEDLRGQLKLFLGIH